MLALVGYVAVVQPKQVFVGYPRGFVPVPPPAGVLVLFGLLMLVLPGRGRATSCTCIYERPLGGSAPAAARAPS